MTQSSDLQRRTDARIAVSAAFAVMAIGVSWAHVAELRIRDEIASGTVTIGQVHWIDDLYRTANLLLVLFFVPLVVVSHRWVAALRDTARAKGIDVPTQESKARFIKVGEDRPTARFLPHLWTVTDDPTAPTRNLAQISFVSGMAALPVLVGLRVASASDPTLYHGLAALFFAALLPLELLQITMARRLADRLERFVPSLGPEPTMQPA